MSKKPRQRDRAKEQFWRKVIKKRERSGLTIRAFCEREGLTELTYQSWRRELLKRDGARQPASGGRAARADGEIRSNELPTFASITVGEASPDISRRSAVDHSMPIEIVLRENVRVRVGRGVDLHLLDQVLSVMEHRGC